MIGTIAQASAAMLAIFFAAVSVVASTSYAKLATGVRALIINDDLNRRYLRTLAHLTAVCVIALVVQALGFEPLALVVLYIGILALFSILGFFALGARTFALFSPALLVGYPNRSFARAVESVTPAGKRWLDPSFQKHSNRIADQQLEVLSELVASAMSDDHPSMRRAVHEIAVAIHRMLRFYAHWKPSIPNDSEWFAKKAQFARLQLGMGTEAEIALKTGVIPPAAPVPDHHFVERQCDATLLRCLEHTLSQGALEDVIVQLMDFNATATARASLLQQDGAASVAGAVCEKIVNWIVTTEAGVTLLGRLQAVDVACVVALSPILNTAQTLCETPPDKLFRVSNAILAGDVKALHMSSSPPEVLGGLNDILRRIEFERLVEDRVHTQRWYVEQLIASEYADFIRKVVKGITAALDSNFLAPSQTLLKAQRPVEASIWIQRSIEACSKARNQIEALSALFSELRRYHHTEAPWHALDDKAALQRVEDARSETIRMLGDCIPGLLETADDDNLPDLVGQARIWMADELLSLMEAQSNGKRQFARLFAAYFDATIAVSQRMFALSQEPRKGDYVRAGMDAMLDLLELSGLALLFSELDGSEFGKIVSVIWTKYLGDGTNRKQLLTQWLNPVDARLILPLFSPSNAQRFDWERRFVRVLVERGVIDDRDHYGFGRRRKRSHGSAVIRSLHVHMGHLFDPPSEYFAALYLAPRATAEGVPLPCRVTKCLESIEREREKQEGAENA